MSKPLVFNIQKFSVHDGPGIRTTVFFKGCPLRCKWCHNPEGLSFCGKNNQTEKFWAVSDLVCELEKDQIFYDESGGGVTLSGGEPMAQDMDYIVSLISALGRKGITVTVDTCGYAPLENFIRLLPFSVTFLYDIKIFDNDAHLRLTGVPNKLIFSNLSSLCQKGAAVYLRLPLIAEINDSLNDMKKIYDWTVKEGIKFKSVNLLPYHSYAHKKYTALGLCFNREKFFAPSNGHLDKLKEFWENTGHPAVVGGSVR